MPAEFTVLASGSSGNSALLRHGQFGLLIDCGIGPRVFTERLAAANVKWPQISAVVLTHTHSDHWNRATFFHLHRMRIPLILHPAHAKYLSQYSAEFPTLLKANLVRYFEDGQPLQLTPALVCRPLRVSHDSDPTFAFYLEGTDPGTSETWSLGYASDLGHTTDELLRTFADVDVLALEFNHNVELQQRSRRTRLLIERVLGDYGHLSNEQAGDFVRRMFTRRTEPLQSLFQLHLSRECNRPEFARTVGYSVLTENSPSTQLITAQQDRATPTVVLTGKARKRIADEPAPMRLHRQPCLPGME